MSLHRILAPRGRRTSDSLLAEGGPPPRFRHSAASGSASRWWAVAFVVGVTSSAAHAAPDDVGSESEPPAATAGADETRPPESDRLFYAGPLPGSESQFGPLNVVVNVGLITLTPGLEPRLKDVPWGENLRRLGSVHAHPARSIRNGYDTFGMFAFIEFMPVISIVSAPNYALHFLGEGMLSRKLEEYYLHQGMSPTWAKVTGISTVVGAQTLNEVVEMSFVPDADPIADLFFNAAGIVAFSYDGFARWFSNERVELLWWPGQAMIDVRDTALYNQAETYNLRFGIGKQKKLRLGVLMGTANGPGVGYPVSPHDDLSLHLVIRPNVPEYPYQTRDIGVIDYLNPENNKAASDGETEENASVAARFSWDRSGSLMGSLDVAVDPSFQVTANVYPGLLEFGPVGVGAFAHAGVKSPAAFGVTLSTISVMPGFRLQ